MSARGSKPCIDGWWHISGYQYRYRYLYRYRYRDPRTHAQTCGGQSGGNSFVGVSPAEAWDLKVLVMREDRNKLVNTCNTFLFMVI
jgi:hypothetical protein